MAASQPTVVPVTADLGERLDVLLSLYEGHGQNVAAGLRGPASADELAKVRDGLDFELPAEVLQLWKWRNGWVDGPDVDPLWFRDSVLAGTPEVEQSVEIMSYYDYPDLGLDVKKCVPIAAFEGAVLAVVTGEQTILPGHPNPVVSFFEGVDPYFHSVSTMVETAIEWVSSPDYDPMYASLADENVAWRRLNPDLPFW